MILTYIEWRNEAPWWFLSDQPTLVAVDREGNEYVRWRYVAGDVWRRSGNITHPHLAEPCPICDNTGEVWLGSQPYGLPGESYAPCSCPAGDALLAAARAARATCGADLAEPCPNAIAEGKPGVCGPACGCNPPLGPCPTCGADPAQPPCACTT